MHSNSIIHYYSSAGHSPAASGATIGPLCRNQHDHGDAANSRDDRDRDQVGRNRPMRTLFLDVQEYPDRARLAEHLGNVYII